MDQGRYVLWPDHLSCPRLGQWLPEFGLNEIETRVWKAPRVSGWRPARASLRATAGFRTWEPSDRELAALIVMTPLGDLHPPLDVVLPSLAMNGRVIDLANPVVRWGDRLRPLLRRHRATRWAVERAAMWKRLGGVALEQWASSDSGDVLVTMLVGPRRGLDEVPS